ncbi:MAG: serine hydrolase domain-containing protein, partial [Enterococcus faecalis]|nr:serine hydrolase domain-containing protein [Enterococcus faecalis]
MNQIAIQETIQRLINQQVVPGVAWGTITEGSLSEQYTGFLGNTGPFARQKVSSASLYDLASLTKVIGTTNRMLQLIDTNQLAFSTTVGEILPTYQGLSCSIGELLLHQSGLPADVADKKNVTKKSLQEIILTHSLSERGKTIYSDLGYYLLGEIIQVLDRCSLEESFQTYVFQPMNLQHTSFTVSDFAQAVPTEITKQRGVIQGVVHDSKAYQLKAPIGSAGLFATLPDLLTFVQCFMNNRYPSGKPLFSEKMF